MALEHDLPIILEPEVIFPFSFRSEVTKKPPEKEAAKANQYCDNGGHSLEQANMVFCPCEHH
jgi:hypothetical protein